MLRCESKDCLHPRKHTASKKGSPKSAREIASNGVHGNGSCQCCSEPHRAAPEATRGTSFRPTDPRCVIYIFAIKSLKAESRMIIYMVLNACFIDFSNLLVEIPKMTKPELINVAETLTKRLKDSTLELERLNEAYDELHDYKNVLRGRLQKQSGTFRG